MIHLFIVLVVFLQFYLSFNINVDNEDHISFKLENETFIRVETSGGDNNNSFHSSDDALIRDKLHTVISESITAQRVSRPFIVISNVSNDLKENIYLNTKRKKKNLDHSENKGAPYFAQSPPKDNIRPSAILKRSFHSEQVPLVVTPFPENIPLQIPRPDLVSRSFNKDSSSAQSESSDSEMFKRFSNTMSQTEQYLMQALSNHNINEKSCSFNGINRRTCIELRQLSSLFWSPPFAVDSRTSVKSFAKPEYLDFFLNSVSLIDVWDNHINSHSQLDFDIVDTTYEELIHYYNTKPDSNFVLPKMSHISQNNIYSFNRSPLEVGGPLDSKNFAKRGPLHIDDLSTVNVNDYYDDNYSSAALNPQLRIIDDQETHPSHLSNLTVSSPELKDIKPRIVFHAPPEFPTEAFVKAMSDALPSVLKRTSPENDNQMYGLFKNLPFGATKKGKLMNEKIKESLKTLMLLTTPSPQLPFISSLATLTTTSNVQKEAKQTTLSTKAATTPTPSTTTKRPNFSVVKATTPVALIHQIVTPSTKQKGSTLLYEGFQLPSSLIISSPDSLIPTPSFIIANSSMHDANVVELPYNSPLGADDAKIIIRLKSDNGKVSRKFAIPSSRFNKNGITEIKLENGKKLRVRFKRKHDKVAKPMFTPYRPFPQRYYEQKRRKPTSTYPGESSNFFEGKFHEIFGVFDKGNSILGDMISGNAESAFNSATGFVKDMFDDINTYKYYDNLLTLVAFASFLGFLYSRGIAIANSITPMINSGLGKTESWLSDLQNKEDISGVEKIINSIRGAFEKWGFLGDDKEAESQESGRLFSGSITRVKLRSDILNNTLEDLGKTLLLDQLEKASKLSVFLIDVATKVFKRRKDEENEFCLARPACELNRESLALGGISAVILPIISTMLQVTIDSPKDSFSVLELFRPIWLSDEKTNCEKIPICNLNS
ncbi:UNVERIFIED_CONTAM: hypothetical protein RMT77_007350 [Armadillidium vulgare]